ncbi:hypothetical protein CHU92_07235 [Flavobacterium cyanobacteriorum]|uniref:YdbS-like PH domain-containing protein n=1 Tax=Flavobacterium cyanobacteriorum TaxID=2022802 RepID=A0A255Z936_9FLAO|nr:PH domain-containing protein [Flavobacterium cyanobacteriorum]OYQ37949.1 hypothetical protein CHU92_07235 [Flavobacterium cyanobacteriorum]
MRDDFSQPQRQSLVGVVVMFTDNAQKLVRALWPMLIVILLRTDKDDKSYLVASLAAGVLLLAISSYLKYINFTFHLDEDNEEFIVRKGVFNKKRIAIPLDKIQQVNINQSVIQKIIGVHELEVDTAGSSNKEVSIRAITHKMAITLKSRLLQGKKETPADASAEPVQKDEKPFITISLASLFKTGITSNYVRSFALLIAFIITLFQQIEDFFDYMDINDDPLDDYISTEIMLQFIAFIITGILLLTIVVNLSRTIIKYFDFRITRQPGSLLLSYGLLNTRNTILRAEKVQILTVGRNYFQKKFGIQDLKIRQAALTEENPESKKSLLEIPGCNDSEKDTLLELLLGEVPEKGIMYKPNYRKLVLGLFVRVVIPVLFYYVIGLLVPELYVAFIIPFYVFFAAILTFMAYRNSRLFVTDKFIIRQKGAWDIDNDYVMPHKIQSFKIYQYFWQKQANVGTIIIYTAGGHIHFGVADYNKMKNLLNYWLYQVETTGRHWM